jgi:histidinol-phosphate phosphatase family protein
MWLENIDKSWTLFLDRDGVINVRNFEGYITNTTDFIFKEGVLTSLSKFDTLFHKIIIITNQQGVGKGIFTLEELHEIHTFMRQEITKYGGRIDAVFSATNLKNSENNRRKPAIAMGLEAKLLFQDIDFSKSIMVGDTDSDIVFGKNLGMKTILIKSDEICKQIPDLIVNSLEEIIEIIKQ